MRKTLISLLIVFALGSGLLLWQGFFGSDFYPLETSPKTDSEAATGVLGAEEVESSSNRARDGFTMPETIFVDGDGFIRDHNRMFRVTHSKHTL